MSGLTIEHTTDENGILKVEMNIDGEKKATFSASVEDGRLEVLEGLERALQGLPKHMTMSMSEILKIVSLLIPELPERIHLGGEDTETLNMRAYLKKQGS